MVDATKEQRDLIVSHIASFLTISDAASLISNESTGALQRSDSWAVGVDMGSLSPSQWQEDGGGTSWEQQLAAPRTPAFISISPGATPSFDIAKDDHHISHFPSDFPSEADHRDDSDCNNDHDYDAMEEILFERRRRWVQQRLATAVFSHPGSVRTFCVQAYQSARNLVKERRVRHPHNNIENPETSIEPLGNSHSIRKASRQRKRNKRRKLVSVIAEALLNNVPLSVFIDVLEVTGEVSLDTTFASFSIAGRSLDMLVQGTLNLLRSIWHFISNFNPFQLLEAIVSFQFNAMGKTSEVLASGIQRCVYFCSLPVSSSSITKIVYFCSCFQPSKCCHWCWISLELGLTPSVGSQPISDYESDGCIFIFAARRIIWSIATCAIHGNRSERETYQKTFHPQ